ncbi:MAG TPA: flavohemoglobin expression-modulating QEGLA motif protein [Gammaproteobacteria bacterium]|nr:flavohemoglobin expression-modulating QEGLA motif protein [Gammaproteobacteria bacterium]
MRVTSAEWRRFQEWDRRVVEAGQAIRVLTTLAWPESVYEQFKQNWQRGQPRLPVVEPVSQAYSGQVQLLETVLHECDRTHPIGEYLYLTANSYLLAAEMLAAAGHPRFTELSIALYGQPGDDIARGALTHLDAATYFIDATREFMDAATVSPPVEDLSAESVSSRLQDTLTAFFRDDDIRVVLDPAMASKAAAGAQRIRIRGATLFSALDVAQLLWHEGYVHMLTALNGRKQPRLTSLSLGAPRTTWTQEGLATFSELVSGSIDLNRMRRLALRTRAVQMGLEGADFLDIYRFFLEQGQDEHESFQSTARIFRGGDPRGGGVVFTKDVVYLQGLIRTHTFLRKAVQSNKFQYAEHLFAGRLTLGDVVALEPFFENGDIAPPHYEPPWLQNRSTLAAYLSYSVFANRINLGTVSLDDFLLMENRTVR